MCGKIGAAAAGRGTASLHAGRTLAFGKIRGPLLRGEDNNNNNNNNNNDNRNNNNNNICIYIYIYREREIDR